MKNNTNFAIKGALKNKGLRYCFSVFLLFCLSASVFVQGKNPKGGGEPIQIYYGEEKNWKDKTWQQNGFEVFIGGGAYFGGKETANYYNGAPENPINLNLIFKNPYYWKDADNSVLNILRRKYPFMDTAIFNGGYNYDSRYNVTMDITLGAKYRFKRNWYVELSYSFRRLTCENHFTFKLPSEESSFRDVSNREFLLAKEDRHYIDISVGYIFQKHSIVKPFIAVGGLFTYIDIKSFSVFIESTKPTFDLISIAKNPDYVPGVPTNPGNNYKFWRGPGYGCSFTVGLKLVAHRMVSLDPVFQLSLASFGNSAILTGFNTKLCLNYMVGVRLVMNDAIFTRNRE